MFDMPWNDLKKQTWLINYFIDQPSVNYSQRINSFKYYTVDMQISIFVNVKWLHNTVRSRHIEIERFLFFFIENIEYQSFKRWLLCARDFVFFFSFSVVLSVLWVTTSNYPFGIFKICTGRRFFHWLKHFVTCKIS